jgi:hypothetical protein
MARAAADQSVVIATLGRFPLQPHPEERRIFAARLKGWQRVRAEHPSFETAAKGRPPQDEVRIISRSFAGDAAAA